MKKEEKKHNLIRAILIIVGILYFIWFLIPVFTSVGLKIGNLTGLCVFGLLTLYGIFFSDVNQFLKRIWKTKAGKVLEIIVGLILAAILALAVITYGCMLHAAGKQAEPNATLIVLGCKVNGTYPSLTLLGRLDAAYEYLEENPDSACIVSGGQGAEEIVTEASVMYEWLCQKGISADRIRAEEQSSDTLENLKFSAAILSEHPEWSRNVAIATNDFHMYRALRTAKSLGLTASPVSADTPWWLYPTYVVREMYGILESWFLQ